MSKLDKIIGYDFIKKELMRVCDMLHNREKYEKMGAKLPNGILLYGDPGLGKTLMAECLIDECGLKPYQIRKTKSNEFVEYITKTFQEAKKNAPSVIFLDDMDKFANEDRTHCDTEEYVAVQAGIDDVKGTNVLVIATVNEIYKLPGSLTRSGRFNIKIEVELPNKEDCINIIKHYLSNKNVSNNIDVEDIAKMMNYSSCADLESVLNEAAVNAAYCGKDKIEMQDIVDAILRKEYEAPDNCIALSDEDVRKIAIHEAGHLVICETLQQGAISIASIRKSESSAHGGFVRKSGRLKKNAYDIITYLGGKAAYELFYGEFAEGCEEDIRKAYDKIRNDISARGTCGFAMVEVSNHIFPEPSESLIAGNEAVVHAELEKYMMKARQILLTNKEFLDNAIEALIAKETLIPSDIKNRRLLIFIKALIFYFW